MQLFGTFQTLQRALVGVRAQGRNVITAEMNLEKFSWKGGGDGLGELWEVGGINLPINM